MKRLHENKDLELEYLIDEFAVVHTKRQHINFKDLKQIVGEGEIYSKIVLMDVYINTFTVSYRRSNLFMEFYQKLKVGFKAIREYFIN